MAKRIIYICDRCSRSSESSDFLKAAYEYEVCDKCFKKFEEHIKAFFEDKNDVKAQVPEKAAEQKQAAEPKRVADVKPVQNVEPKQRKPIDWNKACALKEAGWSNKEIALEVGTTEGTIGAMIYQKIEQYRKGVRFKIQGE